MTTTLDYDPKLYAALHQGTEGDLAFYVRACEGARSVLELGCGYGRVAAHLAARGHAVTGIDNDEGLIAMSPAGFEVVREDMRSFSLATRFDRVIIPHSGIYCLLSEADARDCLARAYEHLAPEGRLVLDAYAADAFHDHARPEDQDDDHLDPVGVVTVDERNHDVFESSVWDRTTQRLTASYLYIEQESGEAVTGVIEQRYLLREQIEALLAEAGFVEVSVAGDFEEGPYDDDSDLLVVTAQRR